MMRIPCFVLLLAVLMTDDIATASVTESLVRQSHYTVYPAGDGNRRQSLNTPSNTNGKVSHNYFLVPTSENGIPAPAVQAASTRSPATAQDAAQTAQSVYQSREAQYSDTGSGGSSFGTSVVHSTSVNRGGTGGVFQNQKSSSNFADYQVTLQGTLVNSPRNQGGYGVPYYSQNPYPYNFDVPIAAAAVPAQLPVQEIQDLFNAFEEIVEVSNRALLEEAASDTTGQTHCLDVPRCSYIPVRKACQGHELQRTADGTCNNLQRPQEGSAFQPFKRYLPPAYDDGVASPRNSSVVLDKQGRPLPLPSPRLITRTVHLVKEDTSHVSGLLMQFGQFVDHDITGTSSITGEKGAIICCGEKKQEHEACMPITIPPGDTHFTDTTCINFVRSLPVTDNANNTIGIYIYQPDLFVKAGFKI